MVDVQGQTPRTHQREAVVAVEFLAAAALERGN